MGQVYVFALLASLNPTLLAATTVLLLLDRPVRLMAGYLLGAYTVSFTLGMLIVSKSESDVPSTTKNTLSPAADLVLGALLLVVAFALLSGQTDRLAQRRRAKKEAKPDKGPPRWQRELSKGSPKMTFVIGLLLTLPGASYLAGLVAIDRLDYSTGTNALMILSFNAIQLWLIEVPLICFLVAPDWTPVAIARAKAWMSEHGVTFAGRALGGIGTLLIIKGVIEFAST